MIRSLVSWSLRFRTLVVGIAAGLLVLGITQLPKTPADVLPEFTPTYVEVQTESLGLSSEEVEQLITVPLEADLLANVPKVDTIRSESLPGLSSVVLVFEPGTSLLDARQLVQEALTGAAGLPQVSKPPAMLQPLSSQSRVMMIGLDSDKLSPIQRSVLARWVIRPRLLGVPGVANVTIWGQRDRQFQVEVDPERLRDRGVTLDQVISTTGNAQLVSPLTFLEASTPGTAGFIDTPNQRLQIQHVLPLVTPEELAKVPVEATGGQARTGGPLRLGNVADVKVGHQPLIGDAVVEGGPGPLLVIEKFPDANTLEVTREVEAALEDMRPGLSDLQMDSSVFRPADYIEKAIDNLTVTIVVGTILLALALFAFLLEWRTALIGMASIVLSLATAVLVLDLTGTTINALVLAGLVVAIGAVVDDAIADTESIWRRLRSRRREDGRSPAATILAASLEMRSALGYATLILLLVVAPVLFIGGVTGDFFRPLVLAYAVAVAASFLVVLTVTPALASLLLSRGPERRESPLLTWAAPRYEAALSRVLGSPTPVFVTAGAVVVLALVVLPGLHGPFIPSFKDRDLLVKLEAPPGTSSPAMTRIATDAAAALEAVPGVGDVGGHVGRAISGDQQVDVNSAELWVPMDPDADYDSTQDGINDVLASYPGIDHELVTYEQQRIRDVGAIGDRTSDTASARPSDVDVLTGASDRPVVVRIYGEDLDVLRHKAEQVRQLLSGIEGVADPRVESLDEQPTIQIEADLERAARHGVKPGEVRRGAAELLQGIQVGSLFDKQKVFDVVVRGTPNTRRNLTDVRNLLIDTPGGGHVRLGQVADVRVRPTPNVIRREAISRKLDVTADVSGQDLASVLDDVENQVRAQVSFPLEYHAEVLRQSEDWGAAKTRTLVLAVAALIGILLLLQAAFGSWRLAAMVLVSVPAALAGGVLAAVIAGGTFSLGSLIGLLTVLGIAVRNVVVLVTRYRGRDQSEHFVPLLILRATRERLVPVLMTAAATALALLPIVVAGSEPGLEIVHPLAVAVLGGLVTSTLVTLILLPALYLRFASGSRPDQGARPVERPPSGRFTREEEVGAAHE
jgi:CzcA family heavy metal efflux pump